MIAIFFLQELQIEKQKQQELFDKHRVELEDSESKVNNNMNFDSIVVWTCCNFWNNSEIKHT